MRAKFQINNINDLDATLTLTMSLRQWKLLAEQLKSDFPSREISTAIYQLTRRAEESWELFLKEQNQ